MKIRLFLFFSGVVLFLYPSCSGPAKKQSAHDTVNDTILKLSSEANNDTVFHTTTPCIVFLWPDSIEMDKMKAKDSNDFYTVMDDFSFYTSQIIDRADSLNIKSFSTDKKNFDFKTSDGKHILLNTSKLKKEEVPWGTYIFNGTDSPKLISRAELSKEFLTIFFKK